VADGEVLVDPAVSRAKFKREIAAYRKLEDEHIRRGWWLVKAEFPEVFVVFGTPNLRPPAVAFGAVLDFTNYDLWPPSVTLVNPFTRVPYGRSELPTVLNQAIAVATPPEQVAAGASAQALMPHTLVQCHDGENDMPFICLPGVREYHHHPAHTGDSWLLHRGRGEGTLFFILNQLHRYGSDPIAQYAVELKCEIKVTGWQLKVPK